MRSKKRVCSASDSERVRCSSSNNKGIYKSKTKGIWTWQSTQVGLVAGSVQANRRIVPRQPDGNAGDGGQSYVKVGGGAQDTSKLPIADARPAHALADGRVADE
jgi:hypothetical protein